jgi:hypothetical protein
MSARDHCGASRKRLFPCQQPQPKERLTAPDCELFVAGLITHRRNRLFVSDIEIGRNHTSMLMFDD